MITLILSELSPLILQLLEHGAPVHAGGIGGEGLIGFLDDLGGGLVIKQLVG
ncbi:hypothetical protein [Bifidobacterium tissieri]|uniref:hypothetical protein n=1 Tax=Bifidobacterium tissieri TaxID=1630162 RepID=UPI0013035C53|nr:hypothetical protein [Bifidobacterium tissieri]